MTRKNNLAVLALLFLSVSGRTFAVENPTRAGTEEWSTEERLMVGRAYLVTGKDATTGYGRYTYLLLAQGADGEIGELNRELLIGYLALEQTKVYESGIDERANVSTVYVPLSEEPMDQYPDIEWLLAHYDFTRARMIRQQTGDLDPELPYTISSPVPLGEGGIVNTDYLEVANLSGGAWSLIEIVGGEYAFGELAAPSSTRGNARPTGRAFLLKGEPEEARYGLYSYLLFAEQPKPATMALYAATLDAYLNVSDVSYFVEEGIPREELNIFYLPLCEQMPDEPTASMLLENYDYARARIVLRVIENADRSGPYIISYTAPLTAATQVDPRRLLVQDLSAVPADLAFLWIKEFISQTRQRQYWDTNAVRRFMLNLRTGIAVFAEALVEVREAHADVSSFLEGKINIPE